MENKKGDGHSDDARDIQVLKGDPIYLRQFSAIVQLRQFHVISRFITNGAPGLLRHWYFERAAAAQKFVAHLDTLKPPNGHLTTIQVREVGSWTPLDRLDLERLAAEEGGR